MGCIGACVELAQGERGLLLLLAPPESLALHDRVLANVKMHHN
jgi:hypothetical protein